MFTRELRDSVAVLTMSHGKANAQDIEFMNALADTLAREAAADSRAVVLTGTGTIFSAGVDLPRLVAGGADYVRKFLPAFHAGLLALFEFPKPVVAAVNGHAIAGGSVVASACDRRIMARGSGRVGIPELLVGVPFPPLALEVMRCLLSGPAFHEAVATGRTYSAEDALARGLVDELVEPAALSGRAFEVARELGAIDRTAWALTKRELRGPAVGAAARAQVAMGAEIEGAWTAPETLEGIRKYVERTIRKAKL
ncbi:MAG: enoyl-CoA hydratase/isomerase family protein [Planctomycetes bacterium]|nr:enoyl-CoA hydratase/isomerase family protein [Planctomycetota bacterium]